MHNIKWMWARSIGGLPCPRGEATKFTTPTPPPPTGARGKRKKMKVKLEYVRCFTMPFTSQKFFELMKKVFKSAKEQDEFDLAMLVEEDTRVEYHTCCGNLWYIELRDGNAFFGYEGTRAGFLRLQPFSCWRDGEGLKWEVEFIEPGKGHLAWLKVPPELFELKVIEHETTTPLSWGVSPFDRIVRLACEPDKAVIINLYNIPIRVVPYQNVYGVKKRDNDF